MFCLAAFWPVLYAAFRQERKKGLIFMGGGYNGNGKQFQKGHAF